MKRFINGTGVSQLIRVDRVPSRAVQRSAALGLLLESTRGTGNGNMLVSLFDDR